MTCSQLSTTNSRCRRPTVAATASSTDKLRCSATPRALAAAEATKAGVFERGQFHQRGPSLEAARQTPGCLQGQTSLAGPTRADHGDHTVSGQQRLELAQLVDPSDETRQSDRQAATSVPLCRPRVPRHRPNASRGLEPNPRDVPTPPEPRKG